MNAIELGQALDFNGLSFAIANIRDTLTQTAHDASKPSVLFLPTITVDGDQWCVLYGSDLQEGVAGFGDTPAKAMEDFDKNWYWQKAGPKEKTK